LECVPVEGIKHFLHLTATQQNKKNKVTWPAVASFAFATDPQSEKATPKAAQAQPYFIVRRVEKHTKKKLKRSNIKVISKKGLPHS